MLHYLFAISSSLVASLLMFDNTPPYGKIHGDLDGIYAPSGKRTGGKYDFSDLLDKTGSFVKQFVGIFWHGENIRGSAYFAKMLVNT